MMRRKTRNINLIFDTLVVIAFVTISVGAYSFAKVSDLIHNYVHSFPDNIIDEVIFLSLAVILGLTFFSIRRLNESKRVTQELQDAEAELRHSEARQRATLDASLDPIITINERGIVQSASKSFERVFGWKLDEFIGQNIKMIMLKPHSSSDDSFLENYRRTGISKVLGKKREFEAVRKDKTVFPCEISISRVNLPNHPGALFTGTVRDISERKRSENALRESEELFRGAFENAPIGVALHTPDGKFTRANRALCQMLGYTEEELNKLTFANVIHDDNLPESNALKAKLLDPNQSDTVKAEKRFVHKDGKVIWGIFNITLIRDESGEPNHLVAQIVDVTARKEAELRKVELENQLRQSQKLETIGTLAGGIAHDFNNILAAILLSAESAALDLDPENELRADLDDITVSAERACDLVKQILTFSRQLPPEMKSVSLRDIVEESLKILRATIPSSIEIKKEFEKTCEDIFADRTQIQQVVMNLCTNAAHAMPAEGGVITISITSVDVDAQLSSLRPNLSEGRHALLSISDNGYGINEDDLERIFELFYTTRQKAQGTGLGLAVVHGIIMAHNGEIIVESKPGDGATFNVYLPANGHADPQIIPEASIARGNGEKILLVDDDVILAQSAKRSLKRLGYVVTATNDPVKALEKFSDTPYEYDLVITDQTMPDLTGVDLAKELRKIRGDIPIILMSGFCDDTVGGHKNIESIDKFIMKPLAISQLSSIIAHVLSEKVADSTTGPKLTPASVRVKSDQPTQLQN